MGERLLLLDVTRLVSRGWTQRLSTGIDRVAHAYLHKFGPRAHAVVQHRGVVKVLDRQRSDALFQILDEGGRNFRTRLATLAPRILAGSHPVAGSDAVYLNVGHTDFDLESHARWSCRAGLRPVYLVHDLIPITHAQHCREHAVRRHLGRVTGALRNASGIIVSTSAVARELEAFARQHRLPTPPVLVAPLAGQRLPVPMRRGPVGDPYFLCVGTIEARKNHRLLLEVWHRLVARSGLATPRLVVVGQWGAGSRSVRDLLETDATLRKHVTVLNRCSDQEMAALIAGARALLMPTLAEGFGLPMVEALGLGTPVIASDLPCFHEIGQGIPTLLDPHDVTAWEAMIATFDIRHPEHARQAARMPHFRAGTWQRHFEQVEAWLPTLQRRAPDPAFLHVAGARPAFAGAGPLPWPGE